MTPFPPDGLRLTNHDAYYQQMADALGRPELEAIVLSFTTVERIQAALAAGDEHLNTIPLALWDGIRKPKPERCACCQQMTTKRVKDHDGQIERLVRSACTLRGVRGLGWSISMTVSTLKAVAKCMAENTR